jgi:hypothetical protein
VDEAAAYLERTTLEHPWADPDIPSLVFVDDGAVKGFIGSYVSRMTFDGQPIRVACPGNFVTTTEVRSRAAGAMLLGQFMKGPQDLTFTETAGPVVLRMWERLGAKVADLGSFSWARIFRPLTLATERVLSAQDGRPRRTVTRLCMGVDAVALRLSPRLSAPAPPRGRAETLMPADVVSQLPRIGASLRLLPAYETPYLEWLFEELGRPRRRGTLIRHVVRDGEAVLGWYLYYLNPGGISRVLQVMASEKDLGSVLEHLFHHAKVGGAAVLDGRLEPRLLESLAQRNCFFRYSGASAILARNSDLRDAVSSARSLLTRVDTEYWPIPPRVIAA